MSTVINNTTAPKTATAPIQYLADGRRAIDNAGFLNILNSRKTLKLAHVGEQKILSVQGTPQFLAKGFAYTGPKGATENQFDRYIVNVAANSAMSMQRAENKQILMEAMKAESAGDMETATDLYNDFLNAIQMSFSVIVNPGRDARKFESGDLVKATIDLVDTASGTKQIVLQSVRYMAPTVVEATKFTVTDLLGDLLDTPTV